MHQHNWRETGKRGVHVEFPTKTEGIKQLCVIYVKCDCGQLGFRKHGRSVVYTWSKEMPAAARDDTTAGTLDRKTF